MAPRLQQVLALAGVTTTLALSACATTAQAPGSAASARSITTLDNATITVPVAGKATAVYFFATGCGSCVPPLRALAQTAKTHPDVVYLPVSIDPGDDATTVNAFLTAAGDNGRTAALDGQARLAGTLGVTSLGTLIVYNPAGAEIYRGVDPTPAQVTAAFDKATNR